MNWKDEEIQQAFNEMDEWFSTVFSADADAHKELKALLKKSLKDAKDIDYLVNLESRQLEVVIFLSLFKILTTNTNKLSSNVLEVLKECLPDYQITVLVQRHRPRVKQSTI